jgi:hypothetical protein
VIGNIVFRPNLTGTDGAARNDLFSTTEVSTYRAHPIEIDDQFYTDCVVCVFNCSLIYFLFFE